MTTQKQSRLDLLQRLLRDLDEFERECRSFYMTEPWLMDEVIKRRFQIISELG